MTDQKLHDTRRFIARHLNDDPEALAKWDAVERFKWKLRRCDHRSVNSKHEAARFSAVHLATIKRTVTFPAVWDNFVEYLKTKGYGQN